MELKRVSVLSAVVVVVAVVSGGCGGSKSKSASSTTSSGASGGSVIKTVTIHETEYKLTPSTISLTKPGTYVFKGVNDGSVTHSLAVEGNGIDKDGMDISAGSSGTVEVTLPKAGSYELYCPVDGHKDEGMNGTITVGRTGASGGTTTDDNSQTDTTETEGTTTSGSGY